MFTFKKSGHRWRVFVGEQAIGMTWDNGSRLKSRSWDYRTAEGVEGKASSRKNAAEAMVRRG